MQKPLSDLALTEAIHELRQKVRDNQPVVADVFRRLGDVTRERLVSELTNSLRLTTATTTTLGLLDLMFRFDAVDYGKFAAAFSASNMSDEQLLSSVQKRIAREDDAPLGSATLSNTPFGTMPDILTNLTQRLAAIDGKQARMERMFIFLDKDNDGCLSRAEFSQAIDALKINLSEDEIRNLFDTFDGENTGKLNWHTFMAHFQISHDKPLPQFLQPKSLRNSGDIIAWTTHKPETVPQPPQMSFALNAAQGVMNDMEQWRRLVGRPRSTAPGLTGSLTDRSSTPDVSGRAAMYRKVNPLLTKAVMGGVKDHVDSLPSDRDPKHVYGSRSKPSEDIKGLLGHDYRRLWIESRAEQDAREAQLTPRSQLKSRHTKASLARLETLKARTGSSLDSPRSALASPRSHTGRDATTRVCSHSLCSFG